MNGALRKFTFGFIAIGVSAVSSAPAMARINAFPGSVSFRDTRRRVTLSNDYFELVFDRANHQIVRLSADHTGGRTFRENLLASDGIRFDDGDSTDQSESHVQLLERKPDRVTVRLTWTPRLAPRVNPITLSLTLGAAERGVHIQAVFPKSYGTLATRGVRVALRQWFLVGLFDRGVVQYIAGRRQVFRSHDRLQLFYTVDRKTGSVAVEPDASSVPDETVLLSGAGVPSGIELRPQESPGLLDVWTSDSTMRPGASGPLPKQTIGFHLYANDLSFPAHRTQNMIDGSATARLDSAAYFTAVYGSAAGVLGSYAEPGSAYPTLAAPDRPYGDAFDFFDPDAWSTVVALSYSGDPLLQKEARKILERSESNLRPDGQMPHHFEGGAATYVSIAKSSQTGPNIFWAIAASEYAAGTGDEAWLLAHYRHLRLTTDWILTKYDSAHRLLRADGPLFIDVFRRDGYTLDTNVMALYLLDRMAEVSDFCGDAESAERYRSRRKDLYAGIRNELWNGEDHFITQRNPDGSTRDLVDYDGNFGAIAFGVANPANAAKLLHRLDSGAHTHPGMRGTWVSERRYEKSDCYGGNDGDSDTAMARIWWLDMAARVRVGDRSTFDTLLDHLETDLLRDVWMSERYDSAGHPAHNDYYHEYPEIVSMVLREMRYGVHVGLRDVTVRPLGPVNFEFRVGKLRVSYSPTAVSILVPGSSARNFTIGGLRPHTGYTLTDGERLVTDAKGTLRFRARAGALIRLAGETTGPKSGSWR